MSSEFEDIVFDNPNGMNEIKATGIYAEMPKFYKEWVTSQNFIKFFSKSRMESILWHDYEAGGTDATKVPPLQYAAIRTDVDMNIIDSPTDILCKLHGDKIPHPIAIKITGINPMDCFFNGLPEPLFFRLIHKEMSVSKTCVTGYNSMGYDETVSRFGFWRSLLPVYSREFEKGNTRWDLLPVTATFCALQVKGINWPVVNEKRSLKLENLAKANGVVQENAHLALDDVKATLDWSRKLKDASPILWNQLYECRRKKMIMPRVNKGNVVLHSKAGYGHTSNFSEPLLMLGTTLNDRNKAVGIKVSQIEALREVWKLSVEEIRKRMFMTNSELEAINATRPPLEILTVNKSVSILTLPWIGSCNGLDMPHDLNIQTLNELSTKILSSSNFINKIMEAFDTPYENDKLPVELALYSEGFPSQRDSLNISILQRKNLNDAFSEPLEWDNQVYATLWERARWKMSGDGITLTNSEEKKYKAHNLASLSEDVKDGKHELVNIKNAIIELEKSDLPAPLDSAYRAFIIKVEKQHL